jgi:hypothetical protein
MTFDVQPIYGWGWRANGQSFEVPGPFRIETVLSENGRFKAAMGKLHEPGHLLSAMWIVLSPIQATETWAWWHLCAFPSEPSIPDNSKDLVEGAPLTGFAKAFPL